MSGYDDYGTAWLRAEEARKRREKEEAEAKRAARDREYREALAKVARPYQARGRWTYRGAGSLRGRRG